MIKRSILTVLLIGALTAAASAANFPFPHSVQYAHGIKPTASQEVMNLAVLYAYFIWSDDYITTEGCADGTCRVHRGPVYDYDTVSEGIGWGMLITVLLDNPNTQTKKYFDGFWGYYQDHLNKKGLMSWKISRHDTVLEKESATEADQNVALALLLASKQWGSSGLVNYYEEANRLVDKILSGEVEAKSYVLKPGADWGGYSITNPAYLAPAAYRLFERFNNDWAKVLDRSYKIYDLFYERQATGLMPDWTVADGSTSYRGNNYTYDACQIPLKIGQDYLWNGQGGKYLDKISYWIVQQSGSNPAAIVDGYKLDGTPIGKYNNAAFVGPLAIAAMSAPKYQTWLDMLYEHLVKIETGGHWGYYSDTLRLVSLLVLTGNFPNFWQTLPEPEEWLKG